ncbi:hypothetical protein INQ51_08485 [Maribellus sp. CM-23]|uniref:DUF6371 domain-containing protein n=1 Tax=Maribellus sp. CM-23 TaxID=2781026 RepID=UPI001F470F70|nr:DUF6371 domain-containing protein [Maribellus sp. CM-23]MCE4564347.1 hypothetical protein [Maribellus sp. CM-23]
MSIEAAKAISIRSLIERETGIGFRKNRLQHCPFCNSGNNEHGNSDSAFSIDEGIGKNYFKCFSCESGGSTIDFIMKFKGLDIAESITYLEQNYLGQVDASPLIKSKKILPPDYVPSSMVQASIQSREKNNFREWISNQYGNEKGEFALKEYQVGTSRFWDGATVFFYIDEVHGVRRGKVMLYSPDTGKRNRQFNPTWVHSILKLKNKPDQCLFGLHLAEKYPEKTIAIVESEKTAIIMSIIFPDYLWMATGGLSFLKAEMFVPLKERFILLFPDAGTDGILGTPYEQWERKMSQIKQIAPNVYLSDLLERKSTESQREKGWDIADYFTILNSEFALA